MAKYILTPEQVAQAIKVDPDFDREELESLAADATSFIKQKTGFDFASESPIEPLAIRCAKLYVKNLFFGSEGYNKEHDYTLGIVSLIKDLEDIARDKRSAT